jgi:SAM-dependent methyltransferase
MPERYWQNWDLAGTAESIDTYWQANAYEREHRALIAANLRQTFGNAPLFEVGCGTGLVAEALFAAGHPRDAYGGGDVSDSMLAIARARLPDVAWGRVDVLDLTGRQDNVVCVHVLQHLPHYTLALGQLARFAVKRLYVVTWFVLEGEDAIRLSEPGRNPGSGRFYDNRYLLSGFIQQLLLLRPVRRLEVVYLSAQSYAVSVIFEPNGQS